MPGRKIVAPQGLVGNDDQKRTGVYRQLLDLPRILGVRFEREPRKMRMPAGPTRSSIEQPHRRIRDGVAVPTGLLPRVSVNRTARSDCSCKWDRRNINFVAVAPAGLLVVHTELQRVVAIP